MFGAKSICVGEDVNVEDSENKFKVEATRECRGQELCYICPYGLKSRCELDVEGGYISKVSKSA